MAVLDLVAGRGVMHHVAEVITLLYNYEALCYISHHRNHGDMGRRVRCDGPEKWTGS